MLLPHWALLPVIQAINRRYVHHSLIAFHKCNLTRIVALLTLCTSILILLFIHSSLLWGRSLQCSIRRWQFHWRGSPIFSLTDSKTNRCFVTSMHNKKILLFTALCVHSQHQIAMLNLQHRLFMQEIGTRSDTEYQKWKYNLACTFTCWQNTFVSP